MRWFSDTTKKEKGKEKTRREERGKTPGGVLLGRGEGASAVETILGGCKSYGRLLIVSCLHSRHSIGTEKSRPSFEYRSCEAGSGAGAGAAIVEIANMMNPMAKGFRATTIFARLRIRTSSGMRSKGVDELIYRGVDRKNRNKPKEFRVWREAEGRLERPFWIGFGMNLGELDWRWKMWRECKQCGPSSLFISTKHPFIQHHFTLAFPPFSFPRWCRIASPRDA